MKKPKQKPKEKKKVKIERVVTQVICPACQAMIMVYTTKKGVAT